MGAQPGEHFASLLHKAYSLAADGFVVLPRGFDGSNYLAFKLDSDGRIVGAIDAFTGDAYDDIAQILTNLENIDTQSSQAVSKLTAIDNGIDAVGLATLSATGNDNFTGTGVGSIYTTGSMMKNFGLQVSAQGGAATSWTVRIDVSLDGLTWTPIISHTLAAQGDGKMNWNGFTPYPALYFRTFCSALSLGAATSIGVVAIGSPF